MPNYKVVICDDASFIRTRLAKLIKSHFPEVEITGVYPGGDDILNHLKNEPIDILITDICMENTDGLTVTKYIYEKKLNTKVIIITGYQDFEYAQKALKYHTSALITKPISTDEMVNAVNEAIKDLEISLTAATEESYQFINRYKQTEKLLQLYFSGKINLNDLNSNRELANSDAFNDIGFLVNFYIPSPLSNDPSCNWDDLMLIQNDNFKIYSLGNSSSAASYIVLLTGNSESCREILGNIISDAIKSLHIFNNIECVSYVLELNNIKSLLMTDNFKEYNKYLSSIQEDWNVNQYEIINSISNKFSNDEFKIILSELLVYISKINHGLDLSSFYEEIKLIDKLVSGKEILCELHKIIAEDDSESYIFSELIVRYINDNIFDKDLSLEKVSKHFGYSPEHFSRKFKKALNITFQNYLAALRIEEAKKLLSDSSLSVVAVSNKIGFKDPAYFSKVFKKKTGLLPKEWRSK